LVFVEEQRVPCDLEWDNREATAIHILAEDPDGEPVGTARLLSNGQIGRMAVLKSRRKTGIGTALLGAALEIARQKGLPTPFLNAQESAIPFYRRMGFSETGKAFMEAGIAHRRMELQQNG
jgi:predicted GNAT family N-acyltransferase